MDRRKLARSAILIRMELVRRELARRRFEDYLSLVHGAGWVRSHFSTFLADEIQRFIGSDTGNAYDILLLETPPQHGKSMTVTESLPSWILMKYPETRVILSSYNEESAERFSRRNREKLQRWSGVLFGVELGKLNRATEFELDGHRGRLISRGVMSGITGNAADLLIIDDPIKNREEADSPAYRNKVWGEWLNSLKSRLQANAKVIVIMTPWHEDDLAARILRTEDNIRLLRLPVEAEPMESEPDPLGRQAGEPLCPELGKGKVWLEQFRRAYLRDPSGGQRAWLALYQCRPRAETGNLVLREWWKFYDTPPPDLRSLCVSVDAAFKGGENNDFVAITVWGRKGRDFYLLDCVNRHLTFTKTLTEIRAVQRRWSKAEAVLIEDKANGSAIIDTLQREMFCIPVDPEGGKDARVQAVSPMIESGHVFLPRNALWLEEYLSQWTAFPHGQHDDMVDSSTQALRWLDRFPDAAQPSEEELRRYADEEAAREAVVGGDVFNNMFW